LHCNKRRQEKWRRQRWTDGRFRDGRVTSADAGSGRVLHSRGRDGGGHAYEAQRSAHVRVCVYAASSTEVALQLSTLTHDQTTAFSLGTWRRRASGQAREEGATCACGFTSYQAGAK
jgi:hypothetical protein